MHETPSGDTLGQIALDEAMLAEASAEYIGRWNHLVSTTNWEKGRIILEWRERLILSGAPVQAYSDDAWSRRVGNVSGQHVGRLRRVWERFGSSYRDYRGLYWSHFQAALDWDDAEMWLEGAVQSDWSVAEMRAQRWETMGFPPDQQPHDEDVVTAELDEDADVADEPDGPATPQVSETTGVVRQPEGEPEDDGEGEAVDAASFDVLESSSDAAGRVEPVRPFENLPRLPDDLHEAFESFKLAILAHKLTGWQEISCGDVLAVLDALKQLALAPSEAA
ncbi:MAG: hypothetical protein HUU20_00565 [Pirellulales bacterium]|nr:hypothetical protein [Pirellulales bacterium]